MCLAVTPLFTVECDYRTGILDYGIRVALVRLLRKFRTGGKTMKIKGSVKGWSAVVVLVLIVLSGAMGLRHVAAFNAASVLTANSSGPIPPSPWSR